MAKTQSSNKTDRTIRSRVTKPRPSYYSANNPQNLSNALNHSAYLNKYWWQPASGANGLPLTDETRQARIDKFFTAMTDFSDVWDSDNAFTEGRLIDNDDIEFTCMRIADTLDNLHRHGLSVPFVADPTVKEVISKRQKVWRVDEQERNLTPSQREDAIVEHLRHYKKSCLDAIDHDKDLTILFVAAPITAGKKRDANAASNSKRKQKRGATPASSRHVREETDDANDILSPQTMLGQTSKSASTHSQVEDLTPDEQSKVSTVAWPPASSFDTIQDLLNFNYTSHVSNVSLHDSTPPSIARFRDASVATQQPQAQPNLYNDSQLVTHPHVYSVGAGWYDFGDISGQAHGRYPNSRQSFVGDMSDFVDQCNNTFDNSWFSEANYPQD
jgi:hypothetical protein